MKVKGAGQAIRRVGRGDHVFHSRNNLVYDRKASIVATVVVVAAIPALVVVASQVLSVVWQPRMPDNTHGLLLW